MNQPRPSEALAVLYENYLGEKRWQPCLPSGSRRWVWARMGEPAQIRWDREEWGEPDLYRFRARATRVARREIRRQAGVRRNRFEEVER